MNRAHAAVMAGFVATLAASSARASSATGTLAMQFDGYAHGLTALKLAGTLTLAPQSYSGRLTVRTAGMINWFAHLDSDSTTSGHFAGDAVVPEHYDSTGTTRHEPRAMHMVYENGVPHITSQEPAVDSERTPVPAAETAGSIDTLAAVALLVRQVALSGKCDGNVRMFDGRRLTALTARTVGEEKLAPSPKTHFNGEALRCDFEGTRLAGFIKADSLAQQQAPRHGSAWLATLIPGAPPVPVRVAFDNKVLGHVTLYLTSVSGSPGPMAQNAARSNIQ
ncbi:MAG TPA: DUF3108 domain-containing protein [Acetobacteraceae bacterium]|nr:DUF3108 domain-containing protein [Acetobacteraceae bacterium]